MKNNDLLKLGKKRFENPKNALIVIDKIKNVPGVSYNITVVRDRKFSSLGGWRHVDKNDLMKAFYRAKSEVPDYIAKIIKNKNIPDETAAAGILQAYQLGGEMTLKYADMHYVFRTNIDSNSNFYPPEVINNKKEWLSASELYGGSKSVLIIDDQNAYKKMSKNEKVHLIKQHAAHIKRVNSMAEKDVRYFTAPDMGTSSKDMSIFRKYSPYGACHEKKYGGTGDPSPMTALGVIYGIRAVIKFLKIPENKIKFAIQGACGKVGSVLVKILREEHPKAKIIITDLPSKNNKLVKLASLYKAKVVNLEEIFIKGNIFIPSGPPEPLNLEILPDMVKANVNAVVGPTNYLWPAGQEELIAKAYQQAGIVVAPAHSVNRGGIESILPQFIEEFTGIMPSQQIIKKIIRDVEPTLLSLLHEAKKRGITPDQASKEHALTEYAIAFSSLKR